MTESVHPATCDSLIMVDAHNGFYAGGALLIDDGDRIIP
jgi:hypothetical protein